MKEGDFIKFLGTSGARFVMIKQLRASGGIWLSLSDTNLMIDPGPGTLVKCASSKPKLDPTKLDGIILSHKHLDHSGDVNVMIEAMTDGGFKKKGAVFAPRDALDSDPVILQYVRGYVERIELLAEGGTYRIGNIEFDTPKAHPHHGVESYGFNFRGKHHTVSLVTDTRFFPELPGYYTGDVLILNVVRLKPDRPEIEHLTLEDAKVLIADIKPKLAILTHFGMTMIRAKPWELAEKLTAELGIKTLAARDGMVVAIEKEGNGG